MARKLTQIYEQIIASKEAQTELSDLDTQAGENMQYFIDEISTSKVSIWRLWSFITAYYIWLEEKQDDTFRLEVEELAAQKQTPTLKGYQQAILNYLYGKPLVWNVLTEKFYQELLPSDDEDALKIVKYCAIVKAPNKLRVKVATDNGGVPGTLTTTQANALIAFIDQIVAAMDDFELVNNNADKLNIELDAYVDPLVIDLNTGELILEPGVKPVENAIDEYLLNLDFNGRFQRTKMVDSMQAANGVTDIDLNVLQARYGTFPYADIDVSVVAEAGYFEIDNLDITYKAAE